jgi:hypothetical protein
VTKRESSVGRFCGREPLWEQTIARFADLVLGRKFIARLGIVLEEADETVVWLELLSDGGIVGPSRLEDPAKQANELTSILVASLRTAKCRGKQSIT